MSHEEQRYCFKCGRPLTNAAEMFICWMCEEEEEQRLLEEEEKEAEDAEGVGDESDDDWNDDMNDDLDDELEDDWLDNGGHD